MHTMGSRSKAPEQLPGNDLDSNTSGAPRTRSRKGLPRHTLVQTVRAKQAFLESYAQWANISHACKMSGVARQNIYDWQEHDPEFAAQFHRAEAAATERLEKEAWRRATEGSPYTRTSYYRGEPVGTDHKIEYSDQLMMLLLRARKPETYREKVDVSVSQVVKTIAGVDPASVL